MIYCVEDDHSIKELILYALKSAGYEAMGFSEGKSFFEELKNNLPDLVLLDIMLPGEDGLSILKKMRTCAPTKEIPVIMLTARSAEYDKVLGLDSGADDYIAKPFGVMELLSRIRAVLRRSKQTVGDVCLSIGDLSLDWQKHIVNIQGREISLTRKEFDLLRCLMENRGIVLSRDRLLELVWGYEFEGETRTVDVHIRSLRQKLGPCKDVIETIRGVGYRIGGKG